MDDVLYVIVLALACWRIVSLLVNEDGPFDIFVKFRYFIGVRYDERSIPHGKNVVAGAFSCVWCASVWVGLALAFFSPTNTGVLSYFLTAFALSAAAIIVEKMVNRGR